MIRDFFIYIIYVGYVMYGWIASLLGGVWPQMYGDIGAQINFLGILVMINYISSGVTSLLTYKIRLRLGTSYSNILALGLAAISMLLFANATSIPFVVVAIVFLGASSGIIDVNSNSYVVKAYESKWVSFMHACWGFGATIGPVVMGLTMVYFNNYKIGFYITFVIIILVMISLYLAKRYWEGKKKSLDQEYVKLHSVSKEEKEANVSLVEILKVKNALKILLCFLLANGAGCSLSVWIATMAVGQRGTTATEGALAASVFFFALMMGRIVFGLLADKKGIPFTIKLAVALTTISVICYYIPYKNLYIVFVHSAVVGFVSGSTIPLLNANLKDMFDSKYLSPLIGFGGVFGLGGIALGSAIMTVVANALTIHHVQIVQIISFALIYFIYSSVVKNVK